MATKKTTQTKKTSGASTQAAKKVSLPKTSPISSRTASIQHRLPNLKEKVSGESVKKFFKTRTKLKIASVVAIVLIAAALVVFGNRLIDGIQRTVGVAVVNGQVISKSELEHRLIQSYGSDMTSSLVDETLVLQEAQKENISITQKDIDGQVSKITQQIAPQKLDDALAQRHLTHGDLERQIHVQLIVEKILGRDIKISDKDIQTYFDQNKDTLAQQANKAAGDLKLDDVKNAVIQNLRSSQISAKYQPWVESLRAKANIKTFI
jgi:parvulin-like peptidyl-prolyl isomerase